MNQRVHMINVGTIPSRTVVEAIFSQQSAIVNEQGDIIVNALGVPKRYTCIDCGFCTHSIDEIENHQEYQRRYHTLKQRIKRFFARW